MRLIFPAKRLRAELIAWHVKAAGLRGVVCFSCGNAAQALREEQLQVVEVGPRGELQTDRWWTATEIAAAWPDRLDATSGHLPWPLMIDIGKIFRGHLGRLSLDHVYDLASGSGETLCCLAMAYPGLMLRACYDGSQAATRWDPRAPLWPLVQELAYEISGATSGG